MWMSLYAQTSVVKDVRQTYLWDVTLSMQGKAIMNDGSHTPNIWNEVKGAIIADIESISDDRTEIVVIPFQHQALDEWREYATESGKKTLINKITAYKIPLFTKQDGKIVPTKGKRGSTWTCLYEPLQYVVDKVLSSDKVDILKLMTDGIPDEHQNEYEALLARWCPIAQEKDAYGFYIMLTPQAVDGRLVLEKINPCRFPVVDVANMGGTNVSTLLLTPQQRIAIDIRETMEKNNREINIKYNHNGSGHIQQGYKIHVWSEKNAYLSVDQVVELSENYSVTVTPEYLDKQMMNTLPVEENETIKLYSEPAKGMEKYPYSMTQVKDTPTTLELINKPEKTVKFHVL